MTTVLDRFRLDGKVAIVTGASSGLGVAFKLSACREPARLLVLAARRVERLEATRATVEQVETTAVPLPSPPTWHYRRTSGRRRGSDEGVLGHVDVLVNNAGKGTAVPATRETPAQFREVIDINLNGCYWMAQACGRVMQPGSAIINIASVAGLASGGLPQAAYSASKAGLIGLTRDLAVQWTGRKGIRVTAVAPGYFPSEMTDQFPDGYIDSQPPRGTHAAGPGSTRGARGRRRLPRQPGRRLHHRNHPGRRRRPDSALMSELPTAPAMDTSFRSGHTAPEAAGKRTTGDRDACVDGHQRGRSWRKKLPRAPLPAGACPGRAGVRAGGRRSRVTGRCGAAVGRGQRGPSARSTRS